MIYHHLLYFPSLANLLVDFFLAHRIILVDAIQLIDVISCYMMREVPMTGVCPTFIMV